MAKKLITSREGELAQFQHTQLGVYLAGAFGLCYVWCSSAQGIVDHYHFSKKWFYLYGVLVAFAYLYMRPFVRRGLGSAHRGYLNFYSLYILWLCSALFCHLPSLEALGIDIKADVSLALSIAASSMMVLGVLHGLQAALIHFKWLAPAPGATQQALWSCIILNSVTLAAACSTYFQLCGNGTAGHSSSSSRQGTGFSAFLHDAVCVKYLAPIPTQEYPKFSAYMLYGERNTTAQSPAMSPAKRNCSTNTSWFSMGSSTNSSSSCEVESTAVLTNSSNLVDFVLSAPAGSADDGGSVISPVFTMWITLVALYIINVLVDYVSAYDMSARHISELRRERVKDPDLALLAALSQAAGEKFRQGAHQLAAAQQQRQQQQHQHPERGREQGLRSGLGTKRSKSLDLPPGGARQPWSPRFMAERTLVNLLETTSSFSFKAAALLENIETAGFPTWQQLQSQARLGSLGGLTTWEGLTTLGDRLGQTRTKAAGGNGKNSGSQRYKQQQQQRQGVQQMRRASTDGLDRALSDRQRFKEQSGSAAATNGVGERPEGRRRGKLHTRSKSLSSIQSAGTASGRDDDELEVSTTRQQQQQTGRHQVESSTSSSYSQQEQHDHVSAGSGCCASGSFNSQHHHHQQQQQSASRLSDHSSSNYCSSPFAVAQPDGGFGLCGGFGSAISLYSPGSEGHDAQKLEQILAAAAAAGTARALQGGKAPVGAAATGTGHSGSRADSADSLSSAGAARANSYDSDLLHDTPASPLESVKQQPTPSVAAHQTKVHLEPRGTTHDSELSELLDEGVSGSGVTAGVCGVYDGPSPPFLDMVPWYSGTSADLFKTMFDLMISLKLFLGRFDMRTMQAATAASMADSFNDTPADGDGFTYEHYHEKEELWVDFIADTGDGGNSTYTVARALAAPTITAPASAAVSKLQQQQIGRDSSNAAAEKQHQLFELPRGDVLLIGGDLAYPNPSRDTYEQRLFVPFQEAMPPPPHYHPGRLVVHKPDLPPSFGVQEATAAAAARMYPAGLSPRSSRYASAAALRSYLGPNVFAIPGNHDWIDGLETYIKHIMHKGWLGGWLMPQEKSYFALRLPAGWWVFGLDLALVGDIDMCQYRYFANVVERRLSPSDNVIIVTHEPIWLLEWFWASSSSSNLRQLVRGHLRGRARVHMAGDLHFYMRHSLAAHNKRQQQQRIAGATAAAEQAEVKVAAADELLNMPTADPLKGIPALEGEQQQLGDITTTTAAAAAAGSDRSSSPVLPSPLDAPGGQPSHVSAPPQADWPLPDSSSSPRSRRSSGSSSSSGVESCSTPLPELQDRQQQQHGWLCDPGVPETAAHPDAGSSPVNMACQTLPRLRSAVPGAISQQRAGLSYNTPADSGSLVTSHEAQGLQQQAADTRQQQSKSGVKWALPDDVAATQADTTAALTKQQQQQQQAADGSSDAQQQQQHLVSLLDPEHLIVNGLGGAFLHPTHVFSYSRFACLEDEAAAATAAIYNSADREEHTSYLAAVPISSCNSNSSSSSLAAAASIPAAAATAGVVQYRQLSRGTSSLSVWDPDMLSWHCPMSPSGTSDIWDQQSLQGQAAAAGLNSKTDANRQGSGSAGAYQQLDDDPVPVLRGPPPPPPAAAAAQREVSHGSAEAGAATVAAAAAAVGTGSSSSGVGAGVSDGGVYKCAASFPTAEKSLKLGRKNLHLFRFKNSRFDVIGGALYFLSIVSTLPRCNAGVALLAATSLPEFIHTFMAEFTACWYDIFMNSYLSLITVVLFFLLTLGFAKGGGVGAVSGERQQLQREQKRQRKMAQQQQQQQRSGSAHTAPRVSKKAGRRSPVVGPLVKLRTGGSSTQLMVALLHAGTHLSLAVVLLLLLELGVEVCIKYENLGNDGLHSMYRWFESYQDQHFPDPMGLRDMAHSWSLGLYPGVIKAAMAVYDIPEAIAVARNTVCRAGSVAAGFAQLSRVQLLAYYAGMLAYYWLLAIPAMGFVFGLYLYVCVCWFHVHYDEAFSALRIANFKGFTRLHITKEGDLEIFTLGIDRVPTCWREDERWYGDRGAGSGRVAAHEAAYPSRWVPVVPVKGSEGGERQQEAASMRLGKPTVVGHDDPSMGFKVVDYLKVPRQRPGITGMPV